MLLPCYGLNDSPLTFQMDPTWPASADLRFRSSLVQRPVLRHSDVTDVRDGCDVRHVRLVGDWNVLTYQLNPMNCEILRKLAEHLDAFWSYVFKVVCLPKRMRMASDKRYKSVVHWCSILWICGWCWKRFSDDHDLWGLVQHDPTWGLVVFDYWISTISNLMHSFYPLVN